MPRSPPRPLCLPELVQNPQTRADYIDANPPKYGPDSRPPSLSDSLSSPSPMPPSPTSTFDSYRASGMTLASLASPIATASTRTSLSVHNLPYNEGSSKASASAGLSGLFSKVSASITSPSDTSSGKGWRFSTFSAGVVEAVSSAEKPRWSSTFSGTKSWFGNAEPPPPLPKSSSSLSAPSIQKEIKLSPSMIAAQQAAASLPPSTPKVLMRPQSSPFPSRTPRVGTGLRYYTESNPAPPDIRTQIPDPIDPRDIPPSGGQSVSVSVGLSLTGMDVDERPLPPRPLSDSELEALMQIQEAERLAEAEVETENVVPDIRVSFGGDS